MGQGDTFDWCCQLREISTRHISFPAPPAWLYIKIFSCRPRQIEESISMTCKKNKTMSKPSRVKSRVATHSPATTAVRGLGRLRRLFQSLDLQTRFGRNWENNEDKRWFKEVLNEGFKAAERMGLDLSGRTSWKEIKDNYSVMHTAIDSMMFAVNTALRFAHTRSSV
jgi:hypothetical protein